MPLPPSFTPSFYANHEARMNRKYDILAEEAAARTKSASADYMRAETDAKSLPQYRADLGYHARGAGQLNLEQAATLAAKRYMDPDLLRQLFDSGRLPGLGGANAPGTGAPGADGQPGGVPSTAAPPPIQFQTMPGYPAAQPAAAAVVAPAPTATADAGDTSGILTSPESIADMTPEQLSQYTAAAAVPRGVQGPTAPTGKAAQARLADAQARMPSLVRPTSVTTTKMPATTPLYSTGFRRGIANVPGYAEGDADVLLRRPLLMGAPPARGTIGGGGGGLGPVGFPPGGPAPMPMPAPAPPIDPRTGYPSPAEAGRPNPDVGQPAGPGFGTPYDPNAMTGIPNLGGIVDATLRMVNPDKFAAALETFRPSENVEDRRFNDPTQGPRGILGTASDIGGQIAGGGQALASDIWKAVAGDTAAPGSLADQAGYNQIGGAAPTLGGIASQFLSGIGNMLGGGSATPLTESPVFSGGGGAIPGGDVGSEEYGYRKGTANVKGKGSKGDKGGGSPKGLEAILPLLAAMQGGGAGGPPAGPPPVPGMKKGSADVKAKGLKKGSANVKKSKGGKSAGDQPPEGLEAILPALLMASKGGGAVGPQAANGLPPSMGPGAAAAPGFARGTPSVQPMPNYPFGAGYLFGANEVPGQGTGKVDTVPAMLAPHEAVLNKAAADILGRGLIAALNAQGVKEMGMRRGATS